MSIGHQLMRYCLQVLVILIGTVPGFGQMAAEHPKVQRTNEILRRVGTAFGYSEGRRPPVLVMYPNHSSKRIAYLDFSSGSTTKSSNPYRNRLLLDERLYDVCEQVDGGSGAALAFVIAHELAHLQHGHRTHLSFAEIDTTKRLTRLVKQPRQASQQEAEADRTGLLYAYMAGFDPQSVLGKLFDSLYAAYQLGDELPGYPSKTDRKIQTRLQAETLRPVALIFWVGQTLYCRGYVAEAAQCYQKILNWNPEQKQQYPLREVFNNLGICRLKQALAASPNHPMRYFALPFELDPQNRLLLLDKRGQTKPTPLVDEWLRQADAAFAEAIALDPTYTVAHLNRATSSLLSQNYYKANGYLQDVEGYTPKSSLSATWWAIHSLAHYGLKQTAKARWDMDKAKQKSAHQTKSGAQQQSAQLIAYNWQTLNSLLKKPVVSPKPPRIESAGCQTTPTTLIDVKSPQSAIFSQLLVHETKPDKFLKVALATVQSQPFIEVVLEKQTFILSQSRPR